jgi:segregation and condensation protein A
MDERDPQSRPDAFDPLQVSLPYFDGPLDLLLHLVRKQQLDINEVRLADLTEPYLAYVEHMQEFNLDQAGEFLAIAATLVWLKSKALLPKDSTPDEELDPETVEELLLLRLQEYQRIKESARQLADRDLLGRDIFPRQGFEPPEGAEPAGILFQEISLFSLLEAFRQVLERAEKQPAGLNLMPERARIEDRIEAIVSYLFTRREVHFHDLFLPDATRPEIIFTFIALLEMIRLKAVRVVQTGVAATILCQATEAFTAGGADWKTLVLEGVTGRKPVDEPEPPGSPLAPQAGHG